MILLRVIRRSVIRDTIHSHYRREVPVRVEELRDEISSELAHDNIIFHPSISTMRRILKGMELRFLKTRNHNIIYGKPELSEKRKAYIK